jgi:hypothetical protein
MPPYLLLAHISYLSRESPKTHYFYTSMQLQSWYHYRPDDFFSDDEV